MEPVCEGSFLYMLGYTDTVNASDANSLWQKHRAKTLGIPYNRNPKASKGMKKEAKSPQRNNAEAFIRYLKALYFGDDFVTKEGVGEVSYLNILYLFYIYLS
jgi:hypothetical protein